VSVAVVEAAHTLAVVLWIANEKLVALFALPPDRVVFAVQANIELVGTSAIGVTRTQTLNRAVLADVAKVALANARIDTFTVHTAKWTDWNAVVDVFGLLITVATLALKAMMEIDALLGLVVARVMMVQAFVFRRASQEVPRERRVSRSVFRSAHRRWILVIAFRCSIDVAFDTNSIARSVGSIVS
jgi:hypothetical protein